MYGGGGPRDLPDGGRDGRRVPPLHVSTEPGSSALRWKATVAREAANAKAERAKELQKVARVAAAKAAAAVKACVLVHGRRGKTLGVVSEAKEEDRQAGVSSSAPIYHKTVLCPAPILSHSPDAITLITQCSMDRLPRLAAQLSAWQGPASVAILIEASESSPRAATLRTCLLDALAQLDAKARRHVAVSVAYTSKEPEWYPINTLRNLALSQARTELVFLVDVDFVPSSNLLADLAANPQLAATLKEPHARSALVIPALELSHGITLPPTKAELKPLIASGAANAFHVGHFPKGHSPTDLPRWLDSNAPYEVQYAEYYEPYIIASRRWLPVYDERFEGYGMNKVSHLYHAAVLGCRFFVMPHHFIIATEHGKSSSWERTYGRNADRSRRKAIAALYQTFKAELPTLELAPSTALNPRFLAPIVAEGEPARGAAVKCVLTTLAECGAFTLGPATLQSVVEQLSQSYTEYVCCKQSKDYAVCRSPKRSKSYADCVWGLPPHAIAENTAKKHAPTAAAATLQPPAMVRC